MVTLEYVKKNIVDRLRFFLTQGWSWRSDGTLRRRAQPDPPEINPDLTWVVADLPEDCKMLESVVLWKGIYQHRHVPLRCQSCWKVTVHPKDYLDLRKVEAWQDTSGHWAKAGMETRKHVSAAWGAYWYTQSKTDGIARLHDVRQWCEKNIPDTPPPVLKRGCTEMELALSTTEWREFPEQQEIEDWVRETVVTGELYVGRQPEVVVNNIHQRWLEHAHDRGDMSYVQETGAPLFLELKGYDDG